MSIKLEASSPILLEIQCPPTEIPWVLPMEKFSMFRTIFMISLAAFTIGPLPPQAVAQGLTTTSGDTFERQADLMIPIQTMMGSCPTQVRFWREYQTDFEPGDHLGLMLDVSSIGQGETEFIDSQDHAVTFRTPLSPEFYSCIGTLAHSDERQRRLLNMVFSAGYAYFHFDISPIKPAFEDTYFVNITHQEIVGQYPYVRWSVGD